LLSFFKSKPFLCDLIPNNHIDFHSHLLPGLDDGAATVDDTAVMISKLKQFGCTQLITTPHIMTNVWENANKGIESRLSETKIELKERGITIPIKAAAEYLLDEYFVKLFTNGPLLTLKDSYVLVEMSYLNPPIQLYQILFDLQLAGYLPVLAHPERYSFLHNNFDEYLKLKNAGCLFQVNLLSTVGYYGDEVASVTDKLLKKGMIDFAGSDVHHLNHIAAFQKRLIIKDSTALQTALSNNSLFRF